MVKGKAHPRTRHEGPDGECRYSSTLSLTSALDGGCWSKPGPGRFNPGNDPVPKRFSIFLASRTAYKVSLIRHKLRQHLNLA